MELKVSQALKDAGFPQNVSVWYWLKSASGDWVRINKDRLKEDTGLDIASYVAMGEAVAMPTLEEVIEVCGDIILFKLPKDNRWESNCNGMWVVARASAYTDESYLCASDHFIDTNFSGETGTTPIEAMINYWNANKGNHEQEA